MKRVFIISSGSMFCEGVESLLGRDANVEIAGSETNLADALAHIGRLQPDVVILDQDAWPSEPGSELMSIGAPAKEIRFIALSLQTSAIRCYSRVSRSIENVEDLMEAITQ